MSREVCSPIEELAEQICPRLVEKAYNAFLSLAEAQTAIQKAFTAHREYINAWQVPQKERSATSQTLLVSVTSPLHADGTFWCHIHSLDFHGSHSIQEISNNLKSSNKIQFKEADHNDKPNTSLFYYSQSRKLYLRCLLKSASPKVVQHLDLGNAEDIPANTHLYVVPQDNLNMYPFKSIFCILPFVLGVNLPYEAKWLFSDLVANKNLKLKVAGQRLHKSKMMVSIVLMKTLDGVSIFEEVSKIVKSSFKGRSLSKEETEKATKDLKKKTAQQKPEVMDSKMNLKTAQTKDNAELKNPQKTEEKKETDEIDDPYIVSYKLKEKSDNKSNDSERKTTLKLDDVSGRKTPQDLTSSNIIQEHPIDNLNKELPNPNFIPTSPVCLEKIENKTHAALPFQAHFEKKILESEKDDILFKYEDDELSSLTEIHNIDTDAKNEDDIEGRKLPIPQEKSIQLNQSISKSYEGLNFAATYAADEQQLEKCKSLNDINNSLSLSSSNLPKKSNSKKRLHGSKDKWRHQKESNAKNLDKNNQPLRIRSTSFEKDSTKTESRRKKKLNPGKAEKQKKQNRSDEFINSSRMDKKDDYHVDKIAYSKPMSNEKVLPPLANLFYSSGVLNNMSWQEIEHLNITTLLQSKAKMKFYWFDISENRLFRSLKTGYFEFPYRGYVDCLEPNEGNSSQYLLLREFSPPKMGLPRTVIGIAKFDSTKRKTKMGYRNFEIPITLLSLSKPMNCPPAWNVYMNRPSEVDLPTAKSVVIAFLKSISNGRSDPVFPNVFPWNQTQSTSNNKQQRKFDSESKANMQFHIESSECWDDESEKENSPKNKNVPATEEVDLSNAPTIEMKQGAIDENVVQLQHVSSDELKVLQQQLFLMELNRQQLLQMQQTKSPLTDSTNISPMIQAVNNDEVKVPFQLSQKITRNPNGKDGYIGEVWYPDIEKADVSYFFRKFNDGLNETTVKAAATISKDQPAIVNSNTQKAEDPPKIEILKRPTSEVVSNKETKMNGDVLDSATSSQNSTGINIKENLEQLICSSPEGDNYLHDNCSYPNSDTEQVCQP